jgi:hypothetical protein
LFLQAFTVRELNTIITYFDAKLLLIFQIDQIYIGKIYRILTIGYNTGLSKR